jgi:mono/diheme cytochrome c family protein
MKRNLCRALMLMLLATFVTGCEVQPGQRWAEKKRQRELERRQAAMIPPPPAVPPGEELFAAHCMICHKGKKGGGSLGPSLVGIGNTREGEYLEQVIRQPNKVYPGTVMPAFDRLSQEEVEALVDHLMTLK